MTGRRRVPPPPSPLPSQQAAGAPPFGIWLIRRTPIGDAGVVWLIRRMPDGQWPPDQNAPRDDRFSWWVRSACGHPGGTKQWAFIHEKHARVYEQIFREDPCRWTRCPHRIMIENEKRSKG